MDGDRFDTIIKSLTTNTSRRQVFGGLLGGAVATLTGVSVLEAKKGGNGKGKGKGKGRGKGKHGKNHKGKGQEKVLICHKGQTIEVARPAVDAHVRNHGDTVGPCPTAPTCTDSVKNGSETDVDCGGGTCPRCANDKTCAGRDDCVSALCDSTTRTCEACTLAPTDNCGLDADNTTACVCRLTNHGQVCTKPAAESGTFDECGDCPDGTHCVDPTPGAPGPVSCYKPCGVA